MADVWILLSLLDTGLPDRSACMKYIPVESIQKNIFVLVNPMRICEARKDQSKTHQVQPLSKDHSRRFRKDHKKARKKLSSSIAWALNNWYSELEVNYEFYDESEVFCVLCIYCQGHTSSEPEF